MPVENATYINQLNENYPEGDDPRSEGDDHLKMFKGAVKRTFPNITGPITRTNAQLNSAPYDKTSLTQMLGASVVLTNPNNSIPGATAQEIQLGWHAESGRIRYNVDGLTPPGGFVLDSEFTGGRQQKTPTGWQHFPGGFRIAWGSFVAILPTANQAYQFSVALANSGIFFNQVVWAGAVAGSGNGGSHVTVTVEGFDPGGIGGFVSAGSPGNRLVRWWAFGF